VSHLDYFLHPQCWLEANLRIARDFPDVIFLPSSWMEYGMAVEPAAFGSRFSLHADRTPDILPLLPRSSDAAALQPVNPLTDGLMPFVLDHYRTLRARILDLGFTLPMVAARGPLCTAAFLRGLTPFLTDLVEAPADAEQLLELTTSCAIDWLTAQANAIGDCAEGILVLDDIPGFLSPAMYRRFAHPYLVRVAAAFPAEWVKVYHNDANVRPLLSDLATTGFDVVNWSHKIPVQEAAAKTGGGLCLMGNVAPLGIAVRGTAEDTFDAARDVIEQAGEAPLILSVGGGVSPGMPAENVLALCQAASWAVVSNLN
jgi:uroporphyrinogen-III decarboxylase